MFGSRGHWDRCAWCESVVLSLTLTHPESASKPRPMVEVAMPNSFVQWPVGADFNRRDLGDWDTLGVSSLMPVFYPRVWMERDWTGSCWMCFLEISLGSTQMFLTFISRHAEDTLFFGNLHFSISNCCMRQCSCLRYCLPKQIAQAARKWLYYHD